MKAKLSERTGSGARVRPLTTAAAIITANLATSLSTSTATSLPSATHEQWPGSRSRHGSKTEAAKYQTVGFVSSKTKNDGISGLDMETLRLLGVPDIGTQFEDDEEDFQESANFAKQYLPTSRTDSEADSVANIDEIVVDSEDDVDDKLDSYYSDNESLDETDERDDPENDTVWWNKQINNKKKENKSEEDDENWNLDYDVQESESEFPFNSPKVEIQTNKEAKSKQIKSKSRELPSQASKRTTSPSTDVPTRSATRLPVVRDSETGSKALMKVKKTAAAIFNTENKAKSSQKKVKSIPSNSNQRSARASKQKGGRRPTQRKSRKKINSNVAARYAPSLSLLSTTFEGLNTLAIVKFVACIAGVQMVWSWVTARFFLSKDRRNMARFDGKDDSSEDEFFPMQDKKTHDSESAEDGMLNQEEAKALQRLGLDSRRYSTANADSESEEFESVAPTVSNNFSSSASEATGMNNSPKTLKSDRHQDSHKTQSDGRSVDEHSKGPRMLAHFLRIRGRGQEGPTFREISQELHNWRERAMSAEQDVETLNEQWSDTMKKLEESKGQCLRLQSTNRYLKSQLESHQAEMEETLKRERQKATEELARIREAMVEVLDRERKLIRDHMMSASEQVRAAVLRAEENSMYNAQNDFE